MVLSKKTSSKSASCASEANMVCHTPLSAQRERLRNTRFQGPHSAVKSRHGLPVRATHSTALTNRRLFAPLRPLSVDLPHVRGSMRCHGSPLRAYLSRERLLDVCCTGWRQVTRRPQAVAPNSNE
jgi:hypothetical protein